MNKLLKLDPVLRQAQDDNKSGMTQALCIVCFTAENSLKTSPLDFLIP